MTRCPKVLLFLISAGAVACAGKSSTGNNVTVPQKKAEAARSDANAVDSVKPDLGLVDGGLELYLDYTPSDSHFAALPTCLQPLDASFEIGTAFCESSAEQFPLLAGDVTQVCNANADVKVAATLNLAESSNNCSLLTLVLHQFDPALRLQKNGT